MTVSSPSFHRLVQALKLQKKTLAVVEQCCGGLISSGVMAQPGASAVFYGGTVSYNTKKSKPLLLNDDTLHQSLTRKAPHDPTRSEAEAYIESKISWTAATSVAYCQALGTDFAIAEGGASGPTFRPKDMEKGFAVLCVAGKDDSGRISVVEQRVIHSNTNDREFNMRHFADQAAELATLVVTKQNQTSPVKASQTLALNRAVHLRSDEGALAELKPKAKYVMLQGAKILVNSPTEPALLPYESIDTMLPVDYPTTFLGILSEQEQTPVFSVDMTDDMDISMLPSTTSLIDTRTNAPLFSKLHNELALHATALAQWQRRTKCCSLCGGKTILVQGGTACQCTQCHSKSWPRQDPSMIVIISSRDGQRVLLGRSPRHPYKMYTALAGFVEAGEAFESAVAREAFEETGVLVDDGSVQYCGSQPWPFPQSCMIGFIATADDTMPLDVDTMELVDAKWFDRSDVEKAATVPGATMQKEVANDALMRDPTLPLLIPPKGVIARKLIDQWLEKGLTR